jgi:hypothetical protein
MGGRTILSSEVGAYHGGAYSTTWRRILRSICGEYAAGMNLTVLHGFSYADAPGATWPGFAAFSPYNGGPGFAESWGPRHPSWRHAAGIAGFMARTQTVLQTGTSKVDAAVLRQRGFSGTGLGAPWFTAGMGASPTSVGWTHQFLSPRLLELPSAGVSRGLLAPDGPAYKVLVLEGDLFAGREPSLEVSTAERLLELARDGLPIVIIGAWDNARVPGIAKPGENARLQEVVDELLAMPSVRNVADRPFVPDALDDLGLEPDVIYSERSSLLTAHRVDKGVDYYYLSNGFHADASVVNRISHTVSLRRNNPGAVPYTLNAWTGRIERVALYEDEGPDRVRIHVTLEPGETTIIAIGRRDWHNDKAGRRRHATHSDADEVRYTERGVAVRALQAGTYTTTLSDGETVVTEVAELPALPRLSDWSLAVEDWQPGDSATETIKANHELALEELTPWTEIPELQDVSGIGRYTTSVDLGSEWRYGLGAYLELGEVVDTADVIVNGQLLPPIDPMNPVADVGPYLRAGANTIEIEVATTLLNRLRVVNPNAFGSVSRQRYGLMGPVRLVPYVDVAI